MGIATNYGQLIQDDRVQTALYTDPTIFSDELEKIWYREWVYIGHESEVANPGDYVLKRIAQQPLIMNRDDCGTIHVFTNRCTHLGNLLCHDEAGNSNAFRCLYHGWTFKNTGKLLGTPYQAGYGKAFDKGQFNLNEMPRLEIYRGFVFGSFGTTGPSLLEHLGSAKNAIDRLCDFSPDGKIQLTGGWLKLKTATNWKIVYENEIDGYHANFVHKSIAKLQKWSLVSEADIASEHSASRVRYLGHGHADVDYRPQFNKVGKPFLWIGSPKPEKLADYTRKMIDKWGPEETEKRLIDGPPHTVIFPNLFIAELFILVIDPIDVGETIQWQTPIFFQGADDLNSRVLQQTGGSIGPAGMIIADDSAMYERNYLGLQAREPQWVLRSRGLERQEVEADGVVGSNVTDDSAHRGVWQHYLSVMQRPIQL